ncbi:hypothetical protein [Candidatus Leptofilum sp.]|uniref:hypothetical protein n=1 Tax=Candidatus Leptofilum sp. TaxID=3241576 RepID=UPI003B59F031
MSQQTLMELFKFNQQDLDANRKGRLSEGQQARWEAAGQWSQSVMQKIFPLLAAVFILLVGIILTLVSRQYLVGILLTIAGATLVGGGIRLTGQRMNQTDSEPMPSVGRVEGIVHLRENLERSHNELNRRYELEIEHDTFQLFTREQFDAVKNGQRYAVHFMNDENKYIVSIEELA